MVETTGIDVTPAYRRAGQIALELARKEGCLFAVLTDGSPSCGSTFIYDGSFTGAVVPGRGTTTALLEQHGIKVFPESRIADLDNLLRSTDV